MYIWVKKKRFHLGNLCISIRVSFIVKRKLGYLEVERIKGKITEFTVDTDNNCQEDCLGLLSIYNQTEIVNGDRHSSWVSYESHHSSSFQLAFSKATIAFAVLY